MPATDFDASEFADLIPAAKVERLIGATRFTAMPLCTRNGEAIPADEQDDPVCTDPEGTDRALVHQAIIDTIAADLGI